MRCQTPIPCDKDMATDALYILARKYYHLAFRVKDGDLSLLCKVLGGLHSNRKGVKCDR